MTERRKTAEVVFAGRACWRATFVLVLFLVLYLSLTPSLPAELDHRLPDWMGRWSAVHDFLAIVLV